MKVWLVWECHDFYGVFATKELAESYKADREMEWPRGQWEVEERVVHDS